MKDLLITKRTALLVLFVLLATLATGCAGPPGEAEAQNMVPAASPPLPTGAKIVLRVGTGDSGEGLTPHFQIIEMFGAANPDIQVQLEPVGSSDYYGRIVNQIAAGDPPDLLQIGDDAVPMFVSRGALIALDDFIASQDYPLDTDIYLPGVLEPGRWDETQYLLPKDFSPLGVYYNKKLFDAAGLPYPKDGWTWQEFLDTAQKLTKADAGGQTVQWGVQLPAAWTAGFEYRVASAGGRLISEDGKQFTGYVNSPQVQQAVQFYADLYNKYKVAPPPADINAFGGGNSEFDDGAAAMRIFGRWPQSSLKKNPNLHLGVVGMPVGEKRANVLIWSGFGISALSKNPEAAWRFLRFYTGHEGAEVWKDWALPTVKQVADASGLTTDPLEGVWLNELNYLVPRTYTYGADWMSIGEAAVGAMLRQAILAPEADVHALLNSTAQLAQGELDQGK